MPDSVEVIMAALAWAGIGYDHGVPPESVAERQHPLRERPKAP